MDSYWSACGEVLDTITEVPEVSSRVRDSTPNVGVCACRTIKTIRVRGTIDTSRGHTRGVTGGYVSYSWIYSSSRRIIGNRLSDARAGYGARDAATGTVDKNNIANRKGIRCDLMTRKQLKHNVRQQSRICDVHRRCRRDESNEDSNLASAPGGRNSRAAEGVIGIYQTLPINGTRSCLGPEINGIRCPVRVQGSGARIPLRDESTSIIVNCELPTVNVTDRVRATGVCHNSPDPEGRGPTERRL